MEKQKWEYFVKVTGANASELNRYFNEAGADGWELVAVDDRTYFFKRPKS
jgi:hypothetical protein